MVTKMKINTALVDGDYRKFKAAFKRSILGVVYSKNKRKKEKFFQHRVHNEVMTDLMIDKIWSELKNVKNDLNIFKIKGNYNIEWDKEGQIINFDDIKLQLLVDYGVLTIPKITMESRTEPVHLYLFTSEFDFKSKEIKEKIQSLIDEYKEQEITFSEYNLSTIEGIQKAESFNVVGSPTICYDDEKLENPSEKDIKNLLNRIKLSKIIAEESTFNQPQLITVKTEVNV